MTKHFNIGGPCNPALHYMLPPAGRMPEAASLIDDGAYFVVHAPRQSGKTTMFLGLAREINARGEKTAVYCTVETVQEFADPESALDVLQMKFGETPWATEAGLDMNGLLAAFQDFWRKNAAGSTQIYDYHEAVPHLMLMAFLQRVTNGSGRVSREMALGKEALDLGIEFRGRIYPVEVKLRANYDRSHAAACRQISSYMDSLGEREGWLVVFDTDREKPWSDKVAAEDIVFEDRTIHLFRC